MRQVSEIRKVLDKDKDPQKDTQHTRYSTKQKYEAVVLYKMIGNMSVISRQTGIPRLTLVAWKSSDWWAEIEEELRKESQTKLGTSLRKIVDKSLTEVQDRLENGDWIYDQKQGTLKRKPIGAHTVNQILKDGLDRQFAIEKLNKEEKKEIKEEEVTQRLLKLAAEFERYTKAKEITAVIDGEIDNAVHDERTPGLREGEPVIQIETRTDSQTSSSQQSSEALSENRSSSQGGQP